MPNESAFSKSLLAAAISAAFPSVAYSQAAARVDFAAGNVTATSADGRSRPLAKGAEVRVGETVSTQNGRAQMRFTDGAFVSLQPQTDFKIDSYVFDGRGSQNESAFMSLIRGGLRTVTGLIGRTNRDGYRLQTSTATVGIRGTAFSVIYDLAGSVTMFVADGVIAVTNQTGTTLVPGGQSVNIAGPNSPPQTSNELPYLPPEGSGNTGLAGPQNPTQDGGLPPIALLTGTIPNAPLATVTRVDSPSAVDTVSATLNGFGGLQSFTTASQVEGPCCAGFAASVNPTTSTVNSGSSRIAVAGNDGVIAWGRWIGGTDSTGRNLAPYPNGYGPLHYVVGLPVTNMPTTGSATYDAIGATASCNGGCTTAAVTGSTLAVDFGALNGSYALKMNIDGSANNFTGDLSINGTKFNTASGSVNGQGFFAGPGASRAGMAYSISSYQGLNGVVAYKQTGTSPNGLGLGGGYVAASGLRLR